MFWKTFFRREPFLLQKIFFKKQKVILKKELSILKKRFLIVKKFSLEKYFP